MIYLMHVGALWQLIQHDTCSINFFWLIFAPHYRQLSNDLILFFTILLLLLLLFQTEPHTALLPLILLPSALAFPYFHFSINLLPYDEMFNNWYHSSEWFHPTLSSSQWCCFHPPLPSPITGGTMRQGKWGGQVNTFEIFIFYIIATK